MMEHQFTPVIMSILEAEFGELAKDIYKSSELLQYLNEKTRSASRGSKSRSAYGSIYALYVLVEDYVKNGYIESGIYSEYIGAQFTYLLTRQRELFGGSKLQNHALNHRANEEFRKYFPTVSYQPILRDVATQHYWINENLLKVEVLGTQRNIARALLQIIEAYIAAKKDAFEDFLKDCERMLTLQKANPQEVRDFIHGRLSPNVDARVFEIVSYAILKEYYGIRSIFWGWTLDDMHEEGLVLYKTGRTNANDGGIDFVMRPLGRFFQVTETLNVKKYFLDIDKIQRFPLTFVVKSTEPIEIIRTKMEAAALRLYAVRKIVERYMACIEEIINIPILLKRFDKVVEQHKLGPVIREIVLQSKVEFNYEEEE